MPRRAALGLYGEDIAVRYLVDEGCRILARRWRTRLGEIDIVARQGDVLLFVEVKTRATPGLGPPEAAVTPWKRLRLRRAAHAYLRQTGQLGRPHRIDVVAVVVPPAGRPLLRHLRSAVGEE